MAREVFMSGLGELYRPRREPMCFDGSNGRMPGGGSSPLSSCNSGAPKQAVVQTPVKTENCCAASSLGAHVADVIPLQGNLLDDEFRTDDFRINHFKVTECSNIEPHDWTLCAFAHVGEKARRRGTAVYKYVATACPDFRKGTCKRGDACPFAHGVFESWLHPGRYRTQLCKDGLDCDRPVCFFAHSIKELRTPTLPASLANSPDGAAFAAFFGGPSLGSLKAPSLQGSVHPPQPQQPAPPSRQQALAEATRQQQQAMQLLQQQQAALKQGQDALRQEQLNLQAAAMRLQQQYAALAQQQQGLAHQQGQQPSSPMAASSCDSEGAAAHLQSSSFSGSDDDFAFSPEQLRRAMSEAEASHANAALHASAPLNSAVLSAWLAARSGAPGMPPRPALQQMATELDCLPKNGRLRGPAPSYHSHAQWAAACQPIVRCQAPSSAGLPLQFSTGLALPHHPPAPTSLAFLAGYAHTSSLQSQALASTSEEDILPLSVPPVLAAIWDPPPAANWSDMQEPLKPLPANQEPPSQQRGVPLSVQRQLSAC